MALQSTTAIATITLQQASNEVVFSGIPENYRDLILVAGYANSSASNLFAYMNGVTSGYSIVLMSGSSAGAYSGTETRNEIIIFDRAAPPANQPVTVVMQFMDYSATDKHKTMLYRSNSTNETLAGVARLGTTDVVNQVRLYANAGSWNVGSTFSLYGRIA